MARIAKVLEEEIEKAFFYPSDLVNTKGQLKCFFCFSSLLLLIHCKNRKGWTLAQSSFF